MDPGNSPESPSAIHTQHEKREVRLTNQCCLKLIFRISDINAISSNLLLLFVCGSHSHLGFPDLLISPFQWPPYSGSVTTVTPHWLTEPWCSVHHMLVCLLSPQTTHYGFVTAYCRLCKPEIPPIITLLLPQLLYKRNCTQPRSSL